MNKKTFLMAVGASVAAGLLLDFVRSRMKKGGAE